MTLPLLGRTKRSGYVVPLPNHVDDANNIRDIPTRASKRWLREHAEVLWANCVQFMHERDAARERVTQLERAILKHTEDGDDAALYEALDRQDRAMLREGEL